MIVVQRLKEKNRSQDLTRFSSFFLLSSLINSPAVKSVTDLSLQSMRMIFWKQNNMNMQL